MRICGSRFEPAQGHGRVVKQIAHDASNVAAGVQVLERPFPMPVPKVTNRGGVYERVP